jgi:hypothetical protein
MGRNRGDDVKVSVSVKTVPWPDDVRYLDASEFDESVPKEFDRCRVGWE